MALSQDNYLHEYINRKAISMAQIVVKLFSDDRAKAKAGLKGIFEKPGAVAEGQKPENGKSLLQSIVSDLNNLVLNFQKLLTVVTCLDDELKSRLKGILNQMAEVLRQAVPRRSFPFKETPEVISFVKEYFELLQAVRAVIEQMNKSFFKSICVSSEKNKLKALASELQNKMKAFSLIFQLQPREGAAAPDGDDQEKHKQLLILLNKNSIRENEVAACFREVMSSDVPQQPVTVEKKIEYVQVPVEVKVPVPSTPPPTAPLVKQVIIEKETSPLIPALQSFYGFGTSQNYSKALNLFQHCEDQGIPEASHYLGRMYLNGSGCMVDATAARQHFMKGAERGNAACFYELGKMADAGLEQFANQSASQRTMQAVEFFSRAAKIGHAEAACDLGFIYESGAAGQPNQRLACDYYRLAIKDGSARAMNNLAGLILKHRNSLPISDALQQDSSKSPQAAGKVQSVQISDPERAAYDLYQRSSDLGYAKATTNLGVCHFRGIHVPPDLLNARALFDKAVQMGDVEALFYKGYFLIKEATLSESADKYAEAFRAFSEVVRQDSAHIDALFYLGYCFEMGLGTSQNIGGCLKLYRKVLESSPKHQKAMSRLGQVLINFEKDKEEGLFLLKQAAEMGEPEAKRALGLISSDVWAEGLATHKRSVERATVC